MEGMEEGQRMIAKKGSPGEMGMALYMQHGLAK